MLFSSPFHRNRLVRTKEYTAGPLFPGSFSFAKEGKGHTLKVIVPGPINPEGPAAADAVLIVIGMASETGMWLSPTGNWSPASKYSKPFKDAKYTFSITKPVNDPTFAPDFPVSITALKKTQTTISKTGINNWFIVKDGSDDAIRFATHVFETKNPDADPTTDLLTWPVKTEAREALEEISQEYNIREFVVYDTDQSRIDPLDIAGKLKGSIVECSFKLKHYSFRTDDSFNAEIEQVVILRPHPKQPPSPYKNASGPYHPPTMSPTAVHAQEQLAVKHFTTPISSAGPSAGPSNVPVTPAGNDT
ncbi:hypothetical protein FB451DRAFT_1178370 [Mycena latifolia]|nr:hypothetical protein FB451DRAFT_1178370 [Mycena latifolia]